MGWKGRWVGRDCLQLDEWGASQAVCQGFRQRQLHRARWSSLCCTTESNQSWPLGRTAGMLGHGRGPWGNCHMNSQGNGSSFTLTGARWADNDSVPAFPNEVTQALQRTTRKPPV